MTTKGTMEDRMSGALGAGDDGEPVLYNPDTGEPDGVEPTAANELIGGSSPAPAPAPKKRVVSKVVVTKHDAQGRIAEFTKTEETDE
jgi:hypothetical protein